MERASSEFYKYLWSIAGLDRCRDMSEPFAYVALGVMVVAGLMLLMNAVIIVAGLTNHRGTAKKISRICAKIVWIFRVGGIEDGSRRAR
jgi:hypothetical protein